MDRLSRIVVLCSLLAAVALQTRLGARYYGPLAIVVGAAFSVGLAAALAAPEAATGATLSLAYIAPVVTTIAIGRYHSTFILIWIAAMVGIVMASGPLRGWRLPPRWRWPLLTIALVVAVGWPIVIWRETDFHLALLDNYRVANTSAGVAPPVAAVGILETAITHLLGLLWFDCLYARYGGGTRQRFVRAVALPLAVSAALNGALMCYQMFGDLNFWSAGIWAAIRRAAGAMLDANVSGMVAACWMPAFVAVAGSWQSRVRAILGGVGVLLMFVAVWASGSRTALLAASLGLGVTLVAAARQASAQTRRRSAVLIAGLAAAAVLLFSVLPLPTIGPLERLRAGIQSASSRGTAGVLTTLWDRDAYGSASTRAIRDAPLVGVGVGAFTLLSVDYVRATGGPDVPYDNAQNWLRHQLAELGVIGCAGWLLWMALFGATLLRGRPEAGNLVPAASIKGALLGLTAASMLGVPTLAPAVTLTFWTFAFWYLGLLAEPQREEAKTARLFERPAAAWSVVGAIVLTHALGTLYVARHDFSVPRRAQRFGWNYNYGFYDVESGSASAFRWTRQSAVTVVPVGGRNFDLKVWTADPAAKYHPVNAKVWIDDRLVLDEWLSNGLPVERRVPLPDGEKRMVLRTWVNRTWSPLVQGSHDRRELGLAVGDWTFRD
jgi:hypothetical protein